MSMSIIDNQGAVSGRIVLNEAQSGEKGVTFEQGEILKGVVRGVRPDGTISLLIKDKLVDAVSELRVNPGQHLYLSVDGFKNGMTYLKVITAQGATRMEDNNPSVGSRSFGVPSDTDTALIIRKLLQHNLPVTQQNIAETFKAMNLVGDITPRNLEVAVFALEHNVPLDRNILPLISQFIASDGNLSSLVREIVQLLVQMETMARFASPPSTAPPVVIIPGASNPANIVVLNPAGTGVETVVLSNTADISRQGGAVSPPMSMASPAGLTGGNPNIVVLPGAAAPGMEATSGETGSANNSSAAPNPSPTTGEAGAATTADTVLKNAAPGAVITANPAPTSNIVHHPPVNPDPAAPDLAAAKEAKSFDLTEFAKILRMALDSAAGRIAGSSSDVNLVLHDQIKDRPLLLDNLRGLLEMLRANEMLTKTPAGQELLTKISNLQQQITGQALLNSVVKLGPDVSTNNYYFSFPVEIDNQLSYCQLRVQKNTSSRLGQQDNIKLVVSLDTPALGIVMFHIDWHRHGYIQLQGVVETAEAGRVIGENIAELLLSLNELGYRANNLGIKVAGGPEELVLKPRIKEVEQNKVGQFNIDVVA